MAGRVRFVVKFDPRLPNIRDVLKRSWGVLTKDPIMKTCFPKPPMVCYKRVQNIRELLVKAKLPAYQGRCSRRNQERPNGFKPCREPNCPVCDQLQDKTSVISSVTCSSTGEVVEIRNKLTCSSSNVIYCITCR